MMKSNLRFFSAIALCFLLVNGALGQVDACFADPGTTGQPDANTLTSNLQGTRTIQTVDLDGDGDKDYLSSAYYDDEIVWFRNPGNGAPGIAGLSPLVIDPSASSVGTLYATDLDGDGDNDVISGSSSGLKWYRNNGSGNFALPPIVISTDGVTRVFSTDINGDGFYDILLASFVDDKIAWYQNDGIGNFFSPSNGVISTNADGASSVYAIDLDGDGDNDVLSASRNDNKIAWYRNDGQGTFTEITITTNLDFVYDLYAIDIDGDGDNDVLSASLGDGLVAWYANDGQGNFGSADPISTSNSNVRSVYSIDIDGDGDNDVITGGGGNAKVAWYENQGGGNFGNLILLSNSNGSIAGGQGGTWDVTADDMDGDGDNDVVAAVRNGFPASVVWFRNECPPPAIPGCTNPCATNYNPDATEFDGSCVFNPPIDDGCDLTTDSIDQATCTVVNTPPDVDDGCPNTDDSFDVATCEILNISNCPDGTMLDMNCICVSDAVMGCTDQCATNYNPDATVDDGTCTLPSPDDGCALTMDSLDPTTCAITNTPPNVDDGCDFTTDSFDATNCAIINTPPNPDDGCDLTMDSFDAASCMIINAPPNVDDGCDLTIDVFDMATCAIINTPPDVDDGCENTDDSFDVATCEILNISNCPDATMLDMDCNCVSDGVMGCTDPCATNYNADATINDGTCTLPSPDDGCALTMDSLDTTTCAINNTPPNVDDGCDLTTDSFDAAACIIINMPPNVDDGCPFTDDSFDVATCQIFNVSNCPAGTELDVATCVCITFGGFGCTDPNACNYDSSVANDDGSCVLPGDACNDGNPLTDNDIVQADCSCGSGGSQPIPTTSEWGLIILALLLLNLGVLYIRKTEIRIEQV